VLLHVCGAISAPRPVLIILATTVLATSGEPDCREPVAVGGYFAAAGSTGIPGLSGRRPSPDRRAVGHRRAELVATVPGHAPSAGGSSGGYSNKSSYWQTMSSEVEI
jgi:hypothetical protein